MLNAFRWTAVALAATTLAAGAVAAQPAAPAASAPIADVRYEVAFDSARGAARTVGVRMTFTARGADPVLLALPAWTPGAYEISYFAKQVANFAAADAGGRPLAWDKADYQTWRLRPRAAGPVTVTFDARADQLDNAKSWSAPDFLLFNGTNLFPYPVGRPLDQLAATVAVRAPADFRVATGMTPTGRPNEFAERSYHDLVDMPFFVGRFDLDSVQVSGRWTRLATYPAGSVAGERRRRALDWLARVIPPEVAVFGEAPWPTYTVMQIADSAYGGASGLEHQNSHVDVIAAGALDNPFVPGLYAHEIFHAFNVKRLRPADMVPYRYEREQPTPLLWVSEGITDYYGDLAQLRGGVIDSAGFLALTGGKIATVADAPPTGLEDASLNTWVQPVDGSAYLYYPKGSLAGFMLDVLIRDASGNRRSLDTVMRELYTRTYRERFRGFTTAEFLAMASRAAGGRDFTDFYRRYVDGRERYPWDTVLPLAGLRLTTDTVRDARLGLATGADTAGGLLVTSVVPGGAAAAAGLRTGDRLLDVGDVHVRDANFGEEFRARYNARPGAELPLRVRREGAVLTLPARVILVPRVETRLVADPSAPAAAVRMRTGIFHGTTDR